MEENGNKPELINQNNHEAKLISITICLYCNAQFKSEELRCSRCGARSLKNWPKHQIPYQEWLLAQNKTFENVSNLSSSPLESTAKEKTKNGDFPFAPNDLSYFSFYFRTFLFLAILFVVFIQPLFKYLTSPRIPTRSNESSAIGSLRTLSTAQKQFKNFALKDRDSDGTSEYGYFVELSGIAKVPKGKESVEVKPAFVSSVFGATSSSSSGLANKSGYNFILYLPSSGKKALRETGVEISPLTTFPASPEEAEEINRQENFFAVFAWPTSAGNSGNKAFFINQTEELYITDNQVDKKGEEKTFFYSGTATIPELEDIFDESGKFILDGNLILDKPHPKTGLIWEKLELKY